jgi:hypothetical protein
VKWYGEVIITPASVIEKSRHGPPFSSEISGTSWRDRCRPTAPESDAAVIQY